MKLITEAIKKKLQKFPTYSQADKGDDAEVIMKYFGGCAFTLLVTEAEFTGTDIILYGKSTLDGSTWEWGYYSLYELGNIRFPPFGLPVERDMHLKSGITVRELTKR